MATLTDPLLRAVYGVLVDDLDHPVHDAVPENAPRPYVVLGEIIETQADAHDRRGVNAVLTVHCWSAYRGYREVAEMLGAVDVALHRRPLAVPGFRDVSVAATGRQFMRDPDPELRHGVARFRIWATEVTEGPTNDSGDPPAEPQED